MGHPFPRFPFSLSPSPFPPSGGVLQKWEEFLFYWVYGFDRPIVTCYKFPFCAGMPWVETYFSSSFAACWWSRFQRKTRRGQASSLLSVLRWKRVRNSGNNLGLLCVLRALGREIGSGWQYLNTVFIPETVQFGGFIYAYMASHCCAALPAAWQREFQLSLRCLPRVQRRRLPNLKVEVGEASLKLPDLSSVSFFNGAIDGHKLLLIGILFCLFGLGFGMAIYMRLKNLPVHRSMREISELIYETCKTYLVTQGKFILLLWAFIAVIIAAYFGWLSPVPGKSVGLTLPIILAFSLVGIAGSYGVAWFGIRVNTFANSRTAFASLPGKPYPVYQIPLEAGMSIGMMLICGGTADHAVHSAVYSGRLCGTVLHWIRDWRIAGRGGAANCGRHLHQDCRHRVRPDEDRLQDQGRRRAQPGRDCRLHGRQRR